MNNNRNNCSNFKNLNQEKKKREEERKEEQIKRESERIKSQDRDLASKKKGVTPEFYRIKLFMRNIHRVQEEVQGPSKGCSPFLDSDR